MAKKIQETGALNYKQLQDINAETGAGSDGKIHWGALAAMQNRQREAQSSDIDIKSPILQSSEQTGSGDYYGRSMFDPDVAVGQTIADQGDYTLSDMRAENEPWYAKLGAGLGKGLVLAGTTFLDGTVGLLAGLETGMANVAMGQGVGGFFSGLFNNEISNGLNEVNRQIENLLPNYRTQEEQNRPWYQNLGTVNFWADSFLKNLGFTVGAFYSGAWFTKALKGLNAIRNGLGAALAGSIYSAVNEGRIEANNTQHDLLQLHTEQLRDAYNKRYDEIVNDNTMSDIDKQNAITALDQSYDSEEAKNIQRANEAGLIDLAGNTVLLSLDNFNTYGRLFARGFKNAEKTATNSLRTAATHADEKLSSRITRNAETGKYEFEKYGLKDTLKGGLKTAALEGNEEMAQQFLSNFSGNVRSYDSPDAYYTALTDPNAEQKTMDTTKALTQAFVDSYGDGQQWEQFAVGALTGLLGMPTFGRVNNSDSNTYLGKGKVIGLSGGIFGGARQNAEANRRAGGIVDTMNAFQTKVGDKLQQHQRYLAGSQSFTDSMDGFAEDKDAFEFKNAEDNDMFMALSAFMQAGRADDFMQMLDVDFNNMSDEDLDFIAKSTSRELADGSQSKDQGWRNADGTFMSETESGRQQMREELNKKKDKMLSQMSAYVDSLEKVRAIGNNALTDDQVNELAWLDWKVGRFNDRLKQITGENRNTLTSIKYGIDEWLNALKEERKDLTEEDKDEKGNSILEENEKQIKIYQGLSDTLNGMINGDVLTLAALNGKVSEKGKEEETKKQWKEYVDMLKSEDFFRTFNSYSDVSYSDYNNAVDNLMDTFRLLEARDTFNERLQEFAKDPLKLIQNRQKIDKKRENTARTTNTVNAQDRVNNASVSDIVQQMDNGDFSVDDLEEFINSQQGQDSGAKDKVEEAQAIQKATQEANDWAGSATQDDDSITPQAIADFQQLMAQSKKRANSKEELLEGNSEAWNDLRGLDVDLNQLENMTPQQQQDYLQQRVDEAKNVLEKFKAELADRDEQLAGMPSQESLKQDVKNGKPQTPDTIGTGSASSDSSQPQGSANSGNMDEGGQQPLTYRQKAQNLVGDIVETDANQKEQNLNDAENVLRGIDYALGKGLRGSNLAAAIVNTESFKRLSSNIPDLGNRLNNYLAQRLKEIKGQNTGNNNGNGSKNNNQEAPREEPATPTVTPEQANTEKQGQQKVTEPRPTYDYWKPTTTQIGMHNGIGENTPFHEIARTINNVITKMKNGEALDPYEQQVYENYMQGRTMQPYTQEQIDRFKRVYDYLQNAGAFKNVNNGKVKLGSKIHFTIDSSLVDEKGNPIILLTTDDGSVVGDLMSLADLASGRQTGLSAFTNTIIEEWTKKGKPEHFTSDTTTSVRQLMRGKVLYSSEDHTLNDIYQIGTFKLGVALGQGQNPPIAATSRTRKQGPDAYEQSIVPPLNAVAGQPFLLLDTAGRSRRVCVPITMPTFGQQTVGSKLGQAIKDVLALIPNSANDPMSIKVRLQDLLAAEFHVNYDGENVRITYKPASRDQQVTVYNGAINNPNLVDTIVRNLEGCPFQISRKYINQSYFGQDYNRMIGELARVNLPVGTTSTVNDWFTLNPVGSKASRIPSTKMNPNSRTSASLVTFDSPFGKATVNVSDWRVYVGNRKLEGRQGDIIRAIAYGQVTEGVDTSKPYQTQWGMFDPNKNDFVKKQVQVNTGQGSTLGGNLLNKEAQKKAKQEELNKRTMAIFNSAAPVDAVLRGLNPLASLSNEELNKKYKEARQAVLNAAASQQGISIPTVNLNLIATEFNLRTMSRDDFKMLLDNSHSPQNAKDAIMQYYDDRHRGNNNPPANPPANSPTPPSVEVPQAVLDMQKNAQSMQFTEDGSYYVNTANGQKFARVTHLIAADKDGEAFPENSPWKVPSTNIGTGSDEMVRDFMNGRITFDARQDRYVVSGVPVEEIYPNIDRSHATSYLNQWADFKKELDKQGIHIVPRDVVARGIVEITDDKGQKHKINVAGTLDLLGYDDKGNYYIYDMKTKRSEISDKDKAKWARQLSLYKKFLEDEYGIHVKSINIIPTFTSKYPSESPQTHWTVAKEKPHLYNGVAPNQLYLNGQKFVDTPRLGNMITNITPVSLDIQWSKLDEREKKLITDYQRTKPSYTPKGHEVDRSNMDEQATQKGFTSTPKTKAIWGVLSDDQKAAILGMNTTEGKTLVDQLSSTMNMRTGKINQKKFDALMNRHLPKNRVATMEKYTPWRPEKELGWLRSALPQFSDDEHLRITKGLIKLDGRTKAYGRFKDGVIYLSDTAARGTAYHEAFHAVFNTLLDDDEYDRVMSAAVSKYGDLGLVPIEEKLAEDFRKYMQYEETPVIGTLVRAFRTVKHMVLNLIGKENYLNKLYYNISRGRFANRVANATNVDRLRETTYDINQSIQDLDDAYRRGKQIEGTVSSNSREVIENMIDKYDLQRVAYPVKYNNSDKWVIRVTKKNYVAKRNQLSQRLIDLYNVDQSTDERLSDEMLNEQAEREDGLYNQSIEQWSRDKWDYSNLSQEDKDYITERGMSIDEYNRMSPIEKEVFFGCKY